MTIQQNYLVMQAAKELMENTAWYLDELEKLDQKALCILEMIFGKREEIKSEPKE